MRAESRFPATIAAYPLPNRYTSLDDDVRLGHHDLAGMDMPTLLEEQVRVQQAFVAARLATVYVHTATPPGFVPAREWLFERLRAVDNEMATRCPRRS